MDQQRFDDLARALSAHRSRRGLGPLAAGLLAILGAGAVEAKNRRGKHQNDDVKANGKGKKKKATGKKKKKKDKTPPASAPPPDPGAAAPPPPVSPPPPPVPPPPPPVSPPPPPTRCVPTVSCVGVECGSFPDNGCGEALTCGGCPANKMCTAGNVCVCATECCSNAECASGRCSAGGACCAAADEVCTFAGAQCGTVSDPCGQVECGGCTGGAVCNEQNQCIEPCPNPGEIRCFGVCRPGVCCEDSDCPGGEVCLGSAVTSMSCCRPEHSSVTCFDDLGGPRCGTVYNNCEQPVECGGCPASGEICAADNRCGSCPAGTQAVKGETPDEDVCCPTSNVCTRDGRQICCSFTTDSCGYGSEICRVGGSGCCTQSGGRCSGDGDCCSGSCQPTGGLDFCGSVRYCT